MKTPKTKATVTPIKQVTAAYSLGNRVDAILETVEVGPEHMSLLLTDEELESALSTYPKGERDCVRRAYNDCAHQIRFWNNR
jgi:hypothetical protein